MVLQGNGAVVWAPDSRKKFCAFLLTKNAYVANKMQTRCSILANKKSVWCIFALVMFCFLVDFLC